MLDQYPDPLATADYLRSVGVPDDDPEEESDVSDTADDGEAIGGPLPELRRHLENNLLGMIEPNAIHNILPTDPPIKLLVFNQFDIRKALVTEGLSEVQLPGDPAYARAELVLRLPADWPITLDNERHFWPVLWVRRLAHLPIEHGTGYKLFTLYDHEEPLGPGVRFTGFLIIAMPGEHGSYTRSDGERVQLYDLLPLYPDELALADREGIRPLLERLDGRDDVQVVTPDRPSLLS